MTMTAGLCSVTMREAPWQTVIDHAQSAGLSLIEWGSDVHVPPNDEELARAVSASMARAGLTSPSYGTYFRAGQTRPEELTGLIRTATALGRV